MNIHKDCNKRLEIFDEAFTPLRYETLSAYIQSFRLALKYLEYIGGKILEDDKKENNQDEDEDKKEDNSQINH